MNDTLAFILKKFNIQYDKKTPMPIELPDFTRGSLAILFRELKFSAGVEIGVMDGRFTEVLCRENPQCTIYGIDPWINWSKHTYRHHYKDDNDAERFRVAAQNRLSRYKNGVLLKDFSLEAAKSFSDSSLGFAYVDGDHHFRTVVDDTDTWLEKIKPGGIISGHDYVRSDLNIHVKEAILGYTATYNIRPWFIFGRLVTQPDGKKDRCRSWMWVKE